MSTDLTIPLASSGPMGSHRRQAKARDAREAALKAENARPYVEPDLRGLCGARELLGTRVCDQAPHTGRKHNGAGPKDPRGDFWGVR